MLEIQIWFMPVNKNVANTLYNVYTVISLPIGPIEEIGNINSSLFLSFFFATGNAFR